MYFSNDALNQLQSEFALLHRRYTELMFLYHGRKYRRPISVEYARHGFLRRLGTLFRSIENVFHLLPPDRGDDEPERNVRIDAAINIEAFVFNVFGAIDNLAWIWISETELLRNNGSALPASWVGFGPKNTFVRQSLSKDFQVYLSSMDAWFQHLEDFRHALAHRIPLYIPPYIVSPEQEAEWRSLDRAIDDAAGRGDVEAKAELKEKQHALCKFRPWMVHSFSEGSRPVVFHAQLIADIKTIEELALKLLPELPEVA